MGKKVVRLTESELIHLVERIIKEQQEVEVKEGFLDDSISWFKGAVKEVANLFKREYMDQIDEEDLENLKMAASDVDFKQAMSNLPDFVSSEEGKEALETADEKIDLDTLSESYLTEGWFSDKVVRILSRTGIISGLGLFGGGIVSFISELKGYIDLPEFMVQVHNIVESSGCSNFCGPLAFLAMLFGILLALGSAMAGYRK